MRNRKEKLVEMDDSLNLPEPPPEIDTARKEIKETEKRRKAKEKQPPSRASTCP